MKILVIGGNSTVAKAVIPILSEEHTVITAGPRNCDMVLDVTKQVTIPSGVDVVINFAAAFGGKSDQDFIKAIKTNLIGTLNICKAAKKASVKRLILISSIFALLTKDSPYYSIYSLTKQQADELAEFYAQANRLNLTILRPSQIYGDSDDFFKHQPFFYNMIDSAESGKDISLYGKHDPLKNFINAIDLGEIIKQVIDKAVTGTFNATYPSDVSFSEIASTAQEVFAKGGTVTFLKNKPDVADNIFKKDAKLYKKINYTPKISIKEGIMRIKEYRSTK